MSSQEKEIQKSYDGKIMARLFNYAKPHWLPLVVSIALMLFITGVDLSVPYVTKVAIDDYIAPKHQSVYLASDGTIAYPTLKQNLLNDLPEETESILFHQDDSYYLIEGLTKETAKDSPAFTVRGDTVNVSGTAYNVQPLSAADVEAMKAFNKAQILKIAVTLFGILILNFVFTFAHTYLLNYASQKVVYTMREELFAHIESMSLSFFDKNPIGRLVTRVSNDMNNINEMFTNVLVTSLKDFLLLGGTVVVMLLINWKLTLICLATMPFVIFAASVFRVKARNVQREVKVKLARINAVLSENISGMKIIQIFNQEKQVYDDFDTINADFLKSSIQETKVYAVFRPSMNLAYSVSLALLLWFGGSSAIRGVVELGVIVAFISYTQQFFRPIMDLSEKFNIFQSSMASAERIFLLLDETSVIQNPQTPYVGEEEAFKGHIVFKDVWFSYDASPQTEDDYVLKGVSFELKPGESVALVGATGSGKTTIISLLNRFYDIQKGSITIDGVEIRKWDIAALRSKIGIVLQDVFLFAGDIKSNIRLYNDAIEQARIEEIAKYVNAHGFISKLGGTYDEPVTERGSTLSSGQRQLLSFARALAFDPKVLILDEATSNIDTETEQLIQDAITKIIKGRSTLIVAHRLSTIQHADQIIVMSKGEIRERGRHQDLLEREGMYYDLYKLQYANG